MPYTDNPVADYDRYDAQQCRRLATLPLCCCCCEPIQDEHYWDFNGILLNLPTLLIVAMAAAV